MLHELRTYTLVPGGAREYLRVYNETGRQIQEQLLGHLVCLLQPVSGDINQLVFLWAYRDFDDRSTRRAQLMADETFTAFRQKTRHLLVRQESRLLTSA